MIISSDKVREFIKNSFDLDKGFFQDKLYKTKAIKDASFYSPSSVELVRDFELVKGNIASEFNIPIEDIPFLATAEGIYDCDNMARKLRVELNDLHFKRYRNKEHDLPYEYAVWQVTDEKITILNNEILRHDYCICFTQDGIYFADLMKDMVWDINNFRPIIIGIS